MRLELRKINKVSRKYFFPDLPGRLTDVASVVGVQLIRQTVPLH